MPGYDQISRESSYVDIGKRTSAPTGSATTVQEVMADLPTDRSTNQTEGL